MICNDTNRTIIKDDFTRRGLTQMLCLVAIDTVRIWWNTRKLSADVMRERKMLAQLPDHLLQDIGVAREEADQESKKAANQLPIDRLKKLAC